MAPLTSYLLISWALLAACWRPSAARPLLELQEQPFPTINKKCSSSSFTLLQDIRSLLHNSSLFHGVRCPHREVEVINETVTPSACAPILAQNSTCVTSTNTPASFNETKCRVNMERDLAHYSSVLRSYHQYLQWSSGTESSILNPAMAKAALNLTIGKIDDMLQSCFPNSTHVDEVKESDSRKWASSPFSNRMRLCDVTKGFYVRAITINRALGYISSGDHKR